MTCSEYSQQINTRLVWVQKQRFIQIIHKFVVRLHMHKKSYSAGFGKIQNLGHTETESGIVRSSGILGGSRNVGLQSLWTLTMVFHCFHDSPLLHGLFSSSY